LKLKFTAAGFDTTANTLAFAVTLLAANPEWQTWIFEELDQVLPSDPTAEVDYKEIYPQLTRCMAIMVSNHYHPSPNSPY
jgi:cytochrome P450